MTTLLENTALPDESQEHRPPITIILGSCGDRMLAHGLCQDQDRLLHYVPLEPCKDRFGMSLRFQTYLKRPGAYMRWEERSSPGALDVNGQEWDEPVFQTTFFAAARHFITFSIFKPPPQFSFSGTYRNEAYVAYKDEFEAVSGAITIHSFSARFEFRFGNWVVTDIINNGERL